MADQISVVLELVGPYRGQDYVFKTYRFEKGRITLTGSGDQISGAMRYLESTCQAYPVGSDKLKEAIAKIEASKPVDAHARLQAAVVDQEKTRSESAKIDHLLKLNKELQEQVEDLRKTNTTLEGKLAKAAADLKPVEGKVEDQKPEPKPEKKK